MPELNKSATPKIVKVVLQFLYQYIVCRAQFGNVNLFGGSSKNCAKASAKFQRIEQLNEDAMFVILSDVWLDQAKV
jgi:hypothetical protein